MKRDSPHIKTFFLDRTHTKRRLRGIEESQKAALPWFVRPFYRRSDCHVLAVVRRLPGRHCGRLDPVGGPLMEWLLLLVVV